MTRKETLPLTIASPAFSVMASASQTEFAGTTPSVEVEPFQTVAAVTEKIVESFNSRHFCAAGNPGL